MNDAGVSWTSLRFTVTEEAVEAVEFALNSLDALGTEIDYMRRPQAGVCVVGYFNHLPDDEIIQDELHYALRSYGLDEDAIIETERQQIENADWLAEWKKHWKPTVVGRFVIAPPWEEVDEDEFIVIRIEPNMAFGTGTHETTQLCLHAVDELFEQGNSFLDVGTGTGILAVAAAKMLQSGATFLAIDNDPDSILIARENATLNGVGEMIEFVQGELNAETPSFDFVCANLTLDVILPILPLLLERSKKHLILSGILADQEPQIVEALTNYAFHSCDIRRAGEWICLVIEK